MNELSNFKSRFSEYVRPYCGSADEDVRKNSILKEEHTYRVCGNTVRIAEALSLNGRNIFLAETAALFHDIGRFEQFRKYRTFNDSVSVNHGALGAGILKKENILSGLPEKEQDSIIGAVRFHNARSAPALPETSGLLLKLLRDADKLDAWRTCVDFYEMPPEERPIVLGFGLPDVPGYSKPVLDAFFGGKTAMYSDIKSLSDFKLLKLAWVYDMNFKPTFRFLKEMGLVERIFEVLPDAPETPEIKAHLLGYIEKRLKD